MSKKKEIIQAKCNECAYSTPFSDLVITCEKKNMNLVGNAIRICSVFKKK
nr:MAG TPA: hypothetical protein [Caudoviricetes sp.]